jgi:diguanylate cyclase (GGDEF)-like protein/PAS domain S-box-containing protein
VSTRDALSDRLLALHEANQSISAAESVEALFDELFEAANGILHHDSVALLLVDEASQALELVAFRGEYPGIEVGMKLPFAGRGITTWVARQGEAQRVADVTRDDRYVSSGLGRGSELAVPMKLGGRVMGVLDVQRADVGAFADDDVLLLATLASYAVVALGRIRLVGELARGKAQLETLLACLADALITTDTHGLITYFSPGAEDMFGFKSADVLGTRVADYYMGGDREARRVQRHVEEEGKLRNYEAWFKTAAGEPIPTSLSASLWRDREGTVLGTLGVLKDITVEKRLERKLSYTIEMLQEANENLGRLALTDNLSGLKNQRFFHRKLEEELLRSQRTKRPVTLILIDIDKFKRFNDSYGHQVGDRVIQELGATVLQSIRKLDHGCRYGGEEFVVILPETASDNAVVVASRIQETFGTAAAWGELGIEPPTLSIGVAAWDGSPGPCDPEGLVKAADDAMYRVKRRGGNGLERA